MNPALNGSSVIQCFEGSDAIKIHDGITFDSYTGLPHHIWYGFTYLKISAIEHLQVPMCLDK